MEGARQVEGAPQVAGLVVAAGPRAGSPARSPATAHASSWAPRAASTEIVAAAIVQRGRAASRRAPRTARRARRAPTAAVRIAPRASAWRSIRRRPPLATPAPPGRNAHLATARVTAPARRRPSALRPGTHAPRAPVAVRAPARFPPIKRWGRASPARRAARPTAGWRMVSSAEGRVRAGRSSTTAEDCPCAAALAAVALVHRGGRLAF